MEEKHIEQAEAKKSFLAQHKLVEAAKGSFQYFSGILRNEALYPEGHPTLMDAANKFFNSLEILFKEKQEAAFYLIGGELFFETLSLPVDNNMSMLLEQLAQKNIGGIIFRSEISVMEIIRFASLINNEQNIFVEDANLQEMLAQKDIFNVTIHHALLVDKRKGMAIKAEQKKAFDIFKENLEALKEVVQAVDANKASSMRKVNGVVQNMVDYILEDKNTLLGLTNIKMFDEYTFIHSVNTAILAVSLGTHLSFDKSRLAMLGVAALLHDIGKVNIPAEIINKPGTLTDEEWRIVQRHPVEGALLLSGVQDISKFAIIACFEHHQHGENGYPPRKGQKSRHPFSQIISLADSYEAITSRRVYYKRQNPPDKAIRILLKNKGITSSPALLQAFIGMIGIFPIGTLLKLDTGEVGLVMHQTVDLMRPRVLLLTKFDGSEKETGNIISLVETAGGRYKRSIAGTINPNAAKINVKKYFE
jgi:HD-GYP domain-containing protein (c-di-GMP phosphodiesterase class II)